MINLFFIFIQMIIEKRNLFILLNRRFNRIDIIYDTWITGPLLLVQENNILRIMVLIYSYRRVKFVYDRLFPCFREFGGFYYVYKHCYFRRIKELMNGIIIPRLFYVGTNLISVFIQQSNVRRQDFP